MCGGNGRGAAGDAEFAVDVLQVLVHCSRAAAEAAPYHGIGQPTCYEPEHLLLPGSETGLARPGARFACGQPVSRVGAQPRHSAAQQGPELSEEFDCPGGKVRTGSVQGDTDVQPSTVARAVASTWSAPIFRATSAYMPLLRKSRMFCRPERRTGLPSPPGRV